MTGVAAVVTSGGSLTQCTVKHINVSNQSSHRWNDLLTDANRDEIGEYVLDGRAIHTYTIDFNALMTYASHDEC